MSFLPSALILGTLAAVALFLTATRGWAADDDARIRRNVQVAAATVTFQGAHFAEELLTGFHERFPALFGLDQLSIGVFVAFNVSWLAIWSASVWGLRARHRAALFPLWFLGIACIANGIAHPALSFYTGGYFPGLVTSPVVGILGIVLVRRLSEVTQTGGVPMRAA